MVTGIKYKYKEYMLHMRAMKQAKGDGGATPDDGGTGMILFDTIPEDYLEMTWPAVVGFSFTSKTWGEVLVDGLSDIDFDETVFDNLVLPAARKRMVKALVRHSNDAFNDIVSGKGEGSVFLLYGPPGCGKTLTAEAISEMLHRPLYTVSLGQLGVTPAELETKLNEILDLCGRWDALILLDEADIFLEKRSSTGSLERNAMVSVMLRLVEYFKGVLFLTSNRVDALDPAFKTRITLALRYEPLSRDARKTVWTNLLELSGYAPSMGDGTIDVDALAGHVLNGREIKNAIRLGMALAEEDGVPLDQDLLCETIETLNDFNEKMKSAETY
jgi:SpoVK/Ycf46/Vps4 family AAA+-type ATPase